MVRPLPQLYYDYNKKGGIFRVAGEETNLERIQTEILFHIASRLGDLLEEVHNLRKELAEKEVVKR